jgi:hypothetical protein
MAQATITNTNAIAGGALTLANGVLTVSNNLALTTNLPINYVVGTNAAILAVKGNLRLGGIINVVAGPCFSNGTFPLITYTGTLSGSLPGLGSLPAGYACALSSATYGVINLVVGVIPAAPTNLTAMASNVAVVLTWNAVANAASYNVKRSQASGGTFAVLTNVTVAGYTDATVTNGSPYYYVVSALGSGGEGTNSIAVSAMPLPSNRPGNLAFQVSSNQIKLSWPPDQLGWCLQIQTNSLAAGLGTNWVGVPDSTNATSASWLIIPSDASMFFRLSYP